MLLVLRTQPMRSWLPILTGNTHSFAIASGSLICWLCTLLSETFAGRKFRGCHFIRWKMFFFTISRNLIWRFCEKTAKLQNFLPAKVSDNKVLIWYWNLGPVKNPCSICFKSIASHYLFLSRHTSLIQRLELFYIVGNLSDVSFGWSIDTLFHVLEPAVANFSLILLCSCNSALWIVW